jgi:hypothetical protein
MIIKDGGTGKSSLARKSFGATVEIHVLLASPLVRASNHRSGLDLSVDSAVRHRSASLADDMG